MLVGARDAAINARALVGSVVGGARIEPLLLTDGRFALPAEVLTDPAFAAAVSTLSGWSTETPATSDYVVMPTPNTFNAMVNGKTMYHSGRPSSLTMPASNVLRFELRVNDFGASVDSANRNRRSELVANGPGRGIGAGTVWSSFCFILGDHLGLSAVRSGMFGLVHQWHSVDTSVGRSPVLNVDCSNNVFTIRTRSSVGADAGNPSGTETIHYSAAVPAKGAKTYVVLQATFGSSGHLNAWVNGSQVVNVDTPIGYYTDLTDGSGRTELGYPHWGLYTRNQSETDIVYIANPEWGTTDLSGRIASPLSVPDLTW